VQEIARLVPGPVSGEVLATDYEGMLSEGRRLAALADNVVVKVPLGPAGLRAVRTFAGEGIRANVTLCFSAAQALLAAKAGAAYISPFVGRLDDVGQDGMQLIEEVVEIYDNYDFETEVLVASVRHPMHVVQSAQIGAGVVTIPFKVLEKLYKHPLTDVGLERFLQVRDAVGIDGRAHLAALFDPRADDHAIDERRERRCAIGGHTGADEHGVEARGRAHLLESRALHHRAGRHARERPGQPAGNPSAGGRRRGQQRRDARNPRHRGRGRPRRLRRLPRRLGDHRALAASRARR